MSTISIVNTLVRHWKREGKKLVNSNDVWQTIIKGLIMAIMIQISTSVEEFSGPLIINIICKKSRMDIDYNLCPRRVLFLFFFFKPTMLTLVVYALITHRSCIFLDPATTMIQLHSITEHEATLYYCLLWHLIFSSCQDAIFKQ